MINQIGAMELMRGADNQGRAADDIRWAADVGMHLYNVVHPKEYGRYQE